jgi:hypothetical protein
MVYPMLSVLDSVLNISVSPGNATMVRLGMRGTQVVIEPMLCMNRGMMNGVLGMHRRMMVGLVVLLLRIDPKRRSRSH